MLNVILKDQDELDLIAIDSEIYQTFKPKVYDGSDGVEVRHVKSFQETNILISKYVNIDPEQMTVLKYYQTLEHIKEQIKSKR